MTPLPRTHAGEHPRPPAHVSVRLDPALTRRHAEGEKGVARARMFKDCVRFEIILLLDTDLLVMYIGAKNYRGDAPQPAMTERAKRGELPSLTRVDPYTWRIEPWNWDPHTGLPQGSSIKITDVPIDIGW